MKLKLREPQKTVDYFGISIVVPMDSVAVSSDADGVVTAHFDAPWPEFGFGSWESHDSAEVAAVRTGGEFNWRRSLMIL